jgi:hypothetical protein
LFPARSHSCSHDRQQDFHFFALLHSQCAGG